MSDGRRGFSLVEAMIAVLLLAVILSIVHLMVSSGRRGTLHGQETADQHLAEVVLSRAIEQDLRRLIPCPIHTLSGDLPAAVRFDPSRIAATSFLFTRFAGEGVVQVQYVFDEGRKEVRRQEIGPDGAITRSERFGSGLVTRFTVEDCSPGLDASLFWVTMTLQGKLRTTRVDKVFPIGFPPPGPDRWWSFGLP